MYNEILKYEEKIAEIKQQSMIDYQSIFSKY